MTAVELSLGADIEDEGIGTGDQGGRFLRGDLAVARRRVFHRLDDATGRATGGLDRELESAGVWDLEVAALALGGGEGLIDLQGGDQQLVIHEGRGFRADVVATVDAKYLIRGLGVQGQNAQPFFDASRDRLGVVRRGTAGRQRQRHGHGNRDQEGQLPDVGSLQGFTSLNLVGPGILTYSTRLFNGPVARPIHAVISSFHSRLIRSDRVPPSPGDSQS